MDDRDDDLIPTRRSLLSRLRDWNDQSGWNRFFETYWKLIYRLALHCGLNETEAQDVVQETVVSVCKHMPGFRYDPARGSFKAWLLRITQSRITDHLRQREPALHPMSSGSGGLPRVPEIEQVADPRPNTLTVLWDEEWRRNVREAATARVKARVDPKHYQVFDLYAVQGLPLAEVAQLFHMSAARVYLIKHRVSRLFRAEVERLEAQGI